MIRDYTIDFHAERLLKMMEKKDPCACCPAYQYFNPCNEPLSGLGNYWAVGLLAHVCDVCQNFVGGTHGACPCLALGGPEAIKRTWISLEEKGYI